MRGIWTYNAPDIQSEKYPVMARARPGTVDQNLDPANAERTYAVKQSDLPLHCPMPGSYLWNSHPKVYLPIEKSGQAVCPYCSANYQLVDDE